MYRNVLYLLTILSILSSCGRGCDPNLDFSLDKQHQKYINPYKENDTVVFSNESGIRDTIVISEIKSWTSNCEWHASSAQIKHLPFNRWIDGHDGGRDGKFTPIDQTLIQVDKMVSERQYSVHVQYRNFQGQITDTTEVKYDTLFNYCNQQFYRVITDENSEFKKFKNDPNHVMKIYWTDKYGLSGYVLRNGMFFKIII